MGLNKEQKQKSKAKKAVKKHAREKKVVAKMATKKPESILSKVPKLAHKTSFTNFAEAVDYCWSKTYFFARGRTQPDGQMKVIPIGTGFLCGKMRMATCAHCFIDPKSTDPMKKHEDGDVYFFVSRLGTGEHHSATLLNIKLDENLFIYPELDFAVLHLPDQFYTDGVNVYKHPDEGLKLITEAVGIGEEVGVIGYPFQQLAPNASGSGIEVNGVHARVDKGVVNTAYTTMKDHTQIYEFTMHFNPGNSGGPIIKVSTGEVIAWVQGFTSRGIDIEDNGARVKIYSHYSLGVSTTNLKDIAKKHNLYYK